MPATEHKAVSILLSCFRADDLIEDYMQSILGDSVRQVAKLIAIDFPFSHKNADYVKRQLHRYPDLVYVAKKENMSLYDAWNEAARLAETEFLSNLNLDDRVTADYYMYGIQQLREFEADVFSSFAVATSVIGKRHPGDRIQEHIERNRFGEREVIEYAIEDMVYVRDGRIIKWSIPHCAPIWRRSLHDSLGYFDSRSFDFCADFEFWLRAMNQGKRFIVSKKEMVLFYCATGTASDRLQHPENFAIIQRWRGTFPPPGYRKSHLGEEHDLLHHCLNLNALFNCEKSYRHLLSDPGFEHYCSRHAMPIQPVLKADEGPEMLKPFTRLKKFQDIHRDEKCLLLCNGPSLNDIDFRRIAANEFTVFGLNKIYIGMNRLGIQPDYIVAVNKKVIEQSVDQFNSLRIIKFISNRVDSHLVPESDYTYTINTVLPSPYKRFSEDISEYVHEGWTVTHVALQVAYYMGFSKVFIVGMDHRFKQHIGGQENQEAVIEGTDLDHFDPNYFGNGQVWDLPDLVNSEISYRAALKAYHDDGRKIFDCTINGACRIFPKLDIEAIYGAYPASISSPTEAHSGAQGLDVSPAGIQQNAKSHSVNRKGNSVSVIMPAFNAAHFIEIAIGSVLNQDFRDFELIVVDDHSTDDTKKIVRRLAERDPRIKLYDNPAKGVSSARNVGIEVASGTYTSFLDADDSYFPSSISARIKYLEENKDIEVVHGPAEFVDENDVYLGFTLQCAKSLTFRDMSSNPAHLNTLMGRTSLIKKFRFELDVQNGEDWWFLARILRSGVRSDFVKKGAATYRIHGGSTVVDNMEKHESNLRSVIDWIFYPDKGPNVASRFSAGLSLRDRQFVDVQRAMNLLIWQVLSEDVLGAESTLKKFELQQMERVPHAALEGSAVIAGIRRFRVPKKNLGKIALRSREGIADTMRAIDLDRGFATLSKVLSSVFDLEPFRGKKARIGDPADDGTLINGVGFFREQGAHIDETALVGVLLKEFPAGSVMIDVGAHYGTSLAPFSQMGWHVYAYEPDPENRKYLQEKFGKSDHIKIDSRAVAEQANSDIEFFASEESTGISSMLAFHESHKLVETVEVTSLADIVADNHIEYIDFLKIDAEGYDFSVLKGVPWDKIKPEVILCEFEDAKTGRLSHRWTDIAELLVGKGYTVYVSEWYPIVRYGVPHYWRGMNRYPCALKDVNAWGNLLAFQTDPGEAAIREVLNKVVKVKHQNPSRRARISSGHHGRLYVRFAEWLKERNLLLFRMGQFTMRVMRLLKRYLGAAILGGVGLVSLIVAPVLLIPLDPYMLYVLMVGGMLVVFACGAVGAAWVKAMMENFADTEFFARQSLKNELLRELRQTNRIAEQQKKELASTPVCNFGDFQSFNRKLTKDHLDLIQREWAGKLGLELTRKQLSYMAHRIAALESNSLGRLATTIEGAVLRTLVALSARGDTLNILEIGTLFGIGLGMIYGPAKARFPSVHLTAIDPLDGYYGKGSDDLTGQLIDEQTFRRNLAKADVPESDYTLIKALSTDEEAVATVEKKVYDVLIIDGDHSLAGVKSDFVRYSPFVKEGGFIIFDDYQDANWPDVQSYVDSEVAQNPNLSHVGTTWRTAVFRVVKKRQT